LAQLSPLVEEVTEDRLFEILEEALAARVIEELPRSVGRYQFTHALIQETLSSELSTTRRVRLHARIAQALEELYGSDSDAHSAELAHHYSEAEAMIGSEKLVHYSLLAGERALAAYAWEEAQAQFARGLAAKGMVGVGEDPIPDKQSAGLLFGYGRARVGTAERGEVQEAVDILSRAFDYYFENGEVADAVAVASYPVPMGGIRIGMARLIRSALSSVPADSLDAGHLQARLGFEAGRVEGDYEQASAAFAQALSIARSESDASLEMNALALSADVDFYHFKLNQSLNTALEAIELALRAGNIHVEVSARLSAARVLFATAEGEKAQSQSSRVLELSERLGDRYWLGSALVINSVLASLRGDRRVGRELIERAIALSPGDPLPICILGMLEIDEGNVSQGHHYLDQLLGSMAVSPQGPRAVFTIPPLAIGLAARSTGRDDRFDVAAQAAEVVLTSPMAPPLYPLAARSGLGLMAAFSGDIVSAREQYAALSPLQGTMIIYFVSADRVLGLLAHTMNHLDEGAGHFEDCLNFCRKGGYRPELAWACCDYADLLLQRDNDDDREKTVQLLDESLAISSELGMRPLMERVLSRREILRA